jgi:type VI secretion system protein ImpM
VPEDMTSASRWWRDAAIGFCGKIPARGDFVRAGLPLAFADPWDRWMERMLMASRSALDTEWLPAWLEAPVWRFAVTAGVCGPDAVIGLWMPSVDRVGRYYPLTIAAMASNTDAPALIRDGGGLLDAAECAGRKVVEQELAPEQLADQLAAAAASPAAPATDAALCPPDGGLWWTKGAPRVPARFFTTAGLPDENTFSAMLISCSTLSSALFPEEAR